MAFCSSFDNVISSDAIVQSSAEDMLSPGMLVANVLVLAADCTPYNHINHIKPYNTTLDLETLIADWLE
jgi:hypothetical protein